MTTYYLYPNNRIHIYVFNGKAIHDRAGYINLFRDNFGKLVTIMNKKTTNYDNRNYIIFCSTRGNYSTDSCAIVLD